MSAWLRLKKLMIRGSCNPRLMFQHTTLTELGGQRIANPTLEDKVRQELIDSCRHANWKLGGPRGAAVRLGLKRTTLSHKMRRLGIERPPVEETAEPTLEDKVRQEILFGAAHHQKTGNQQFGSGETTCPSSFADEINSPPLDAASLVEDPGWHVLRGYSGWPRADG